MSCDPFLLSGSQFRLGLPYRESDLLGLEWNLGILFLKVPSVIQIGQQRLRTTVLVI